MCQIAKGSNAGRPPEQIALHFIAAFDLEELKLGIGLDALSQNRQAKSASKPEPRADNGGGLLVGIDRLDERSVDLDLVKRKCAQVRKRRVAGAKIVHRDSNAESLDLAQGSKGAVEVTNQRGLGDLDFKPTGRQTGFQQNLVQFLRDDGAG